VLEIQNAKFVIKIWEKKAINYGW